MEGNEQINCSNKIIELVPNKNLNLSNDSSQESLDKYEKNTIVINKFEKSMDSKSKTRLPLKIILDNEEDVPLLRHKLDFGQKNNYQTQQIPLPNIKSDDVQYPPPLEPYKPKISVTHDFVSYGLNMYFKKPHRFSEDGNQGGGPLAPNQPFLSQPWGIVGCPPTKQQNLSQYVQQNLKEVVFCRYGLEYLRSFPRNDDVQIASYMINLDYLIFQKQKMISKDESKLIEMNFLKQKGVHQMKNKTQKSGENMMNNVNKIIIPYYKNKEENNLEFDSVFESGNLAIAMKVSDSEYNCILQNDINTNGHTQWFYFKVKSNFKKPTSIKMNLINLYKPKSLYQYGMRVLTLDVSNCKNDKAGNISTASTYKSAEEEKKAEVNLPKWERSCKDISYIQNEFTNESSPNGLYKVQFTYDFKKGHQEIYFAHSVPYTYSMLNDYLNKNKVKRQTLCHSLAGNKVEYICLTNKQKVEIPPPPPVAESKSTKKRVGHNSSMSQNNQIQKQVIMLTSRVHPGETGASWMIHGLIDTLLNPKNDEEKILVKNLKDHFEFYIIPMLNVDGVVNGNYRCSLAACDLNRKWIKPSKALHPPVYYTKKLCQTLTEQDNKQFFLYLDFHGHSVKKNIFQYGNKTENWMPSRQKCHMNFQPSIFPMMLSKQFDYFNFQDCTFQMPKSKDATARISMFHKLRIPFVFTLESSFAGANKGELAGQHFSCGDLMNVGKYVLKAIWQVKCLTLNKNRLKEITAEAVSQVTNMGDDEVDSDGCSSEEDAEPPVQTKKAIDTVLQEDGSPDVLKRVAVSQAFKENQMAIDSNPATDRDVASSVKKTQRMITLKQNQVIRARNKDEIQSSVASRRQSAVSYNEVFSNNSRQTSRCSCGKCRWCQSQIDTPQDFITNKSINQQSEFFRQTQLNLIQCPESSDGQQYMYKGFKIDPKSTKQQQQQMLAQIDGNSTLNTFIKMYHNEQSRQPGALPNTVKPSIYAQKKSSKSTYLHALQEFQNYQYQNNNSIEKINHKEQPLVQPQQPTYLSTKRASIHKTNTESLQLPESITDTFSSNKKDSMHKNQFLQQFLKNTVNQKLTHAQMQYEQQQKLIFLQDQAKQLFGSGYNAIKYQEFAKQLKEYTQHNNNSRFTPYVLEPSRPSVKMQLKELKGSKLTAKREANLQQNINRIFPSQINSSNPKSSRDRGNIKDDQPILSSVMKQKRYGSSTSKKNNFSPDPYQLPFSSITYSTGQVDMINKEASGDYHQIENHHQFKTQYQVPNLHFTKQFGTSPRESNQKRSSFEVLQLDNSHNQITKTFYQADIQNGGDFTSPQSPLKLPPTKKHLKQLQLQATDHSDHMSIDSDHISHGKIPNPPVIFPTKPYPLKLKKELEVPRSQEGYYSTNQSNYKLQVYLMEKHKKQAAFQTKPQSKQNKKNENFSKKTLDFPKIEQKKQSSEIPELCEDETPSPSFTNLKEMTVNAASKISMVSRNQSLINVKRLNSQDSNVEGQNLKKLRPTTLNNIQSIESVKLSNSSKLKPIQKPPEIMQSRECQSSQQFNSKNTSSKLLTPVKKSKKLNKFKKEQQLLNN